MIDQKDNRHFASYCKLPQNPFHSKIYYFPFSLTIAFELYGMVRMEHISQIHEPESLCNLFAIPHFFPNFIHLQQHHYEAPIYKA